MNKMENKNITLSEQFQNTIENRRKRQHRHPETHKYMTAHFTGLVQSH